MRSSILSTISQALFQDIQCSSLSQKSLDLIQSALTDKVEEYGEDYHSSYVFLSQGPFVKEIFEIFTQNVNKPLVYFTSSRYKTNERWRSLRNGLSLQHQMKYSQKKTLLWSFKNNLKESLVFVSKCLESVSPSTQPTVLKHVDRNLIFTPTDKLLEDLLRSSEFAKLKFKVGISLDQGIRSDPCFKSICMHCHHGLPSIVTLSNVSELFQDYTLVANGFPLRVSSPSKFPFLYRMDHKDDQWVPSKGMFASVLFALAEKHNYTFILTLAPGGGSGIVRNGSWNGVVADLIHDRAEIGLGTSANPARAKLIDFSSQFTYCMVGFVTRLPTKTYSWKAIYKPFSRMLWICTFVSLIAVICIFKLILKFKSNEAVSIKTRENLFSRHYVSNVIFSLVGQALTYPVNDVARFVCIIWLLSGLIISTMYVSKLTELLAFPEFAENPKTFNQLVAAKDFKWGQDSSGGNLYLHFQTSSNQVFQKIFKELQPPADTVNCFQRAMVENFACIAWTVSVRYIFARNLTAKNGELPIKISEETTLQAPVGISMQKQSIFERNMNVLSAWILDMGLTAYWYDKDMSEVRQERIERDRAAGKFHEFDDTDYGPSLLILDNLKGTFYLLILGLGVSTLVFIVESKLIIKYLHHTNRL